MDDKHLDEILRGKLEAFHDTAPVNEKAMLSMMQGLKAAQTPLPWYAPIKPFLVPAVTSLVAGAAVLAIIWMNYEPKIEKLEHAITEIQNSAIHSDTIEKIEIEKTVERPIQTLKPEKENSHIEQGPNSPNLAILEETYVKETENELVDDQSISVDNLVNAVKWVDPGSRQIARQYAGVSILSEKEMEEMGKKRLFLKKSAQKFAPADAKTNSIGFRVGARLNLARSNPDVGNASPIAVPGLFTEVLFGSNFSMGIGANFMQRNYQLRKPERHPHRIKHYPGLPNLAEVKIEKIESTASMLNIPVVLNYRFGSEANRIRPLFSIGMMGGKVVSQSFRYQKDNGEYLPKVEPGKTPDFNLMAMHVEAGTEVRIADHTSARLSVFYNHPLNNQGVEKRKFTTLGVSGAFMLGTM